MEFQPVLCTSLCLSGWGVCGLSTHMTSQSNCSSFQWELPVFPGGSVMPTLKALTLPVRPHLCTWGQIQANSWTVSLGHRDWFDHIGIWSSYEQKGFLGKWADGLSFPANLDCGGWSCFSHCSNTGVWSTSQQSRMMKLSSKDSLDWSQPWRHWWERGKQTDTFSYFPTINPW